MDEQSRMMLYPQTYNLDNQGQGGQETTTDPNTGNQTTGSGEQSQPAASRTHADINTILDQIMNITDQSLDEAQVPFFTTAKLGLTC